MEDLSDLVVTTSMTLSLVKLNWRGVDRIGMERNGKVWIMAEMPLSKGKGTDWTGEERHGEEWIGRARIMAVMPLSMRNGKDRIGKERRGPEG